MKKTKKLLLIYLKRDYKKIIIWILSLGLFVSIMLPITKEFIGEGIYEAMANPAMVAMVGDRPAQGLGPLYSQMMALYTGMVSMVISALHLIAYTRKEEDRGLLEKIDSFQVGRIANSLAVLIEILIVNLILLAFIFLSLISLQMEGISLYGSLIFAGSISFAGILASSIALLMSQLFDRARKAITGTLSVIGGLYILRAMTDASQSKLSMFNPLAWIYRTYPYSNNKIVYLLLLFALSLLLSLFSLFLESKRDRQDAYIKMRERNWKAGKALSPSSYFYRVNRGPIIAWLITYLIFSLAYGSVYGDIGNFINSSEAVQKIYRSSIITLEESYTLNITIVMVCIISILPISIVNRFYSLERKKYLSMIYSTRFKKGRAFAINFMLSLLVSLLGLVLVAYGLAFTGAYFIKDNPMQFISFFKIAFAFFPYILFFIGLAFLCLALKGSLGKLLYVYLAYSALISYFEPVLNLPKVFYKIQPLAWLSKYPLEAFSLSAYLLLSLISLLLVLTSYFIYIKRDLVEEA